MKQSFARLLALFVMLAGAHRSVRGQTTVPDQSAVAVIELEGPINDYKSDQLAQRMDQARAAGAKTVIISIDTWGGLVTSALDISRLIKSQKDIHTIAYVNSKAISAGAMIAMACNEIVMSPSAVIGDCAPISFKTDGTIETLPPAERAKAESPVLADFRDSAARNGHDPLLAEAMVSVGRAVHWIELKDGSRAFVDAAEYTKRLADGAKAVDGVRNPIDSADDLFTVHTNEAIKIGLAKETATSIDSLASARGLNIVASYKSGTGDMIVEALGSAPARMLLIVIFVATLKIALSTPGHGAPEAISVISLGLLIGMPLLTGMAQWWEIMLIFAGLALLAFEIFVIPGHFVAGAIGLLMIVGGLIMTFVPKEPAGPGWLPNMDATYVALQNGLFIVTGGLAASLVLWIWLNRYLPKIPYFRNLVLTTTVGSTIDGEFATHSDDWPAPGAVGTCVTDLKPGGSAAFTDPSISATRNASVVSDAGFVAAGTRVLVTSTRGGYALVKPYNPSESST